MAPAKHNLEGPEAMRDPLFEIGALSGRMDAAENRMERIEDTTRADTIAVHGRIDTLNTKIDAMSAQIQRWLGALALGVFLISAALVFMAAEIEAHGGILN